MCRLVLPIWLVLLLRFPMTSCSNEASFYEIEGYIVSDGLKQVARNDIIATRREIPLALLVSVWYLMQKPPMERIMIQRQENPIPLMDGISLTMKLCGPVLNSNVEDAFKLVHVMMERYCKLGQRRHAKGLGVQEIDKLRLKELVNKFNRGKESVELMSAVIEELTKLQSLVESSGTESNSSTTHSKLYLPVFVYDGVQLDVPTPCDGPDILYYRLHFGPLYKPSQYTFTEIQMGKFRVADLEKFRRCIPMALFWAISMNRDDCTLPFTIVDGKPVGKVTILVQLPGGYRLTINLAICQSPSNSIGSDDVRSKIPFNEVQGHFINLLQKMMDRYEDFNICESEAEPTPNYVSKFMQELQELNFRTQIDENKIAHHLTSLRWPCFHLNKAVATYIMQLEKGYLMSKLEYIVEKLLLSATTAPAN